MPIIASKIACGLVKTQQIPVFLAGLLLELEAKKKKKTLVFTMHFTSRVEKISRNTVFSTRSLKTSANSSKGTKISVNTRFLDVSKYLTGIMRK